MLVALSESERDVLKELMRGSERRFWRRLTNVDGSGRGLAREDFRYRIEIGVIREDVNSGSPEATFPAGVIDRDGASILNVGKGNGALVEMDGNRGADFELMLASVWLGQQKGAGAGFLQNANETLLLWLGGSELL